MKIIWLVFYVVAGTLAGPAVRKQESKAEGPYCPIDDPLVRDGPLPINITLNPISMILEGSQITNLVANGLSGLTYNLSINVLLLTTTFELTIPHIDAYGTYTAEGYLDARPFSPETLPSGNFTGSGLGKISVTDLHIKGSNLIVVNLNVNKLFISDLYLEDVSFSAISIDLGEDLTIGGGKIDWETLNRNLKANFDKDLQDNKAEITEKIQLASNGILEKYNLSDFVVPLPGDPGAEEPCGK